MAKTKAPVMRIKVVRGDNGEYSASFLLSGPYNGQTVGLVGNQSQHMTTNVCDAFESQTGLRLEPGTEKVFRLAATAQRKVAAKK